MSLNCLNGKLPNRSGVATGGDRWELGPDLRHLTLELKLWESENIHGEVGAGWEGREETRNRHNTLRKRASEDGRMKSSEKR